MKSYASAKARGLERLRRLIPKNVPPFLVFPADLSPHQIVQSVLSFFTPGDTLIIRSSAAVEDGQNFSYAGKFLSIPGVPLSTQEFCNAWENCVASLAKAKFGDYGSEQMVARQSLGEVIVQRYVKPLYAGVAFVYPTDWERSTVAIGKGEEITSGAGSGETVACTRLLHSRIAQQNPKICRSLLTILKKIAKLNPAPFDLEFVLTESQVFVVQIRPITARHDGGGFGRLVFDASNIGENYPGLTAPLTYSFISKAYAEVYTGYLRVLQTSEEMVVRQRFALGNLVSYVHGRVFYNLEHWYRLLKMLPFYAVNKKFFETMLSPVKGMSEIDHEESLASLRSSFFFVLYVLFPQRLFRRFEQICQKLFSEFSEQDWKRFTTPELVFRFERLRDSFFSAWAFTIVNDFRVMVFWGLLHALARTVFEKPELYINQLASASRHPESMVPLRELTKLRNHIQGSSALRSLFSQPPGIILDRLRRPEYRRFANKFDRYLHAYGDRSGQELKLEVPKFSEDPGQLLALLKQYCAKDIGTPKQARPLSLPKVKRYWLFPILTVVEHIAVAGIYRREKFRMRRGKAYGLARKVFLELGRRMTQDGLLADPSDVFYLTYEELVGLAAFRSLPFSPKKLVLERKRLFEQYDATSIGATRVLAYGWNSPDQELMQDLSQNSLLKGTGTSIVAPVTGKVVVMEEFSVRKNLKNAILVTKKTDPGWTVLFPLLKGVITESGSTLSHASIIARELRIPCITGVKGCTVRLKTGDRVTMIPETGEVVLQ